MYRLTETIIAVLATASSVLGSPLNTNTTLSSRSPVTVAANVGTINFYSDKYCQSECVKQGNCDLPNTPPLYHTANGDLGQYYVLKPDDAQCWDRPPKTHSMGLKLNMGGARRYLGITKECAVWRTEHDWDHKRYEELTVPWLGVGENLDLRQVCTPRLSKRIRAVVFKPW